MPSRPFVPSSLSVSRRTTENAYGQQGLNRLSSGFTRSDTELVDDEVKDLRLRASLLHMKQMQLYRPSNQGEIQKIGELSVAIEGSTWAQIRKLKAERAALAAESSVARQASPSKAPLSPRSKPPPPRKSLVDESEERQMQVEATLQAEVAKLQRENAKLRSSIPAEEP